MGFRYRRSKKIGPGVRLNISKSGPSLTIGGKHARTTIGHGRVTNSVRTPVKGLYYSSTSSKRKKSSGTGKRGNAKSSGGGTLGCLGSLIAIGGIIAVGVIILYLAIIVALIYIAVTYYKANKKLSPDQVERMGSIIYLNEPDKKYGAWTMYLRSKRLLKSLPKDIAALETKANAFNDENVAALCDILNERETKEWQYQALLEITSEPDFYEPVYDEFYSSAVKSYIDRTFTPIYNDAESLKTERGKKNRYIKYLDRFKPCYDNMPASAVEVIDSFMNDYGIQFSSIDIAE